MRRVGAAILVSIAIAVTFRAGLPLAVAHTTLREAIHHQTELGIGDRNVDVTVELEFHEDASLPERREMDADNDGEITEPETAAYLEAHAEGFLQGIEIRLAGAPLKLVPLYEPKIDLLGKYAAGSHGHILRLYYFARLPHTPEPGDAFQFTEKLWPKVEALRTLEVTAGKGQQWEAQSTQKTGAWQIRYVRKGDTASIESS